MSRAVGESLPPAHFLAGAIAKTPCPDSAPYGRYVYRCTRAVDHEGSHFDRGTDSWWSRTAAGKLRVFKRQSSSDGVR